MFGLWVGTERLLGEGHYYIQGVGYATIEDILGGRLNQPGFLLLLVAAKLLATALTLGSGASGGVFSPLLFLGATAGGVMGLAVHSIAPGVGLDAPSMAIVGMQQISQGPSLLDERLNRIQQTGGLKSGGSSGSSSAIASHHAQP